MNKADDTQRSTLYSKSDEIDSSRIMSRPVNMVSQHGQDCLVAHPPDMYWTIFLRHRDHTTFVRMVHELTLGLQHCH